MEEQNHDVEIQETKEESTKKPFIVQKSTIQLAILGAIALAVITITILLIVLIGNNHTHNFSEWEIIKEATFNSAGEKIRYCECGEKQKEILPKLTKKELTLQEWKTAFDANKYQSFTMTVEYKQTMSKNYGNNTEEKYEVIACLPYFSIDCETKYPNCPDELDTTTLYSANGLTDMEFLPWRLKNLLDDLYEYEDFGFSQFVYDSDSGKYTSRILDVAHDVTISFKNNLIESIEIEHEYYDVDYGDTIEHGSIKISGINATAKPSAQFDKAKTAYNSAIPSIQESIEARRGYQSSHIYDINKIKSTFGTFLQTFILEKNSLTEYSEETYTWYDEEDKLIEESYYSLTSFMRDTTYLNYDGSTIAYDEIRFEIGNGEIESIVFYNDSQLTFSVYFFYED